MSVVAGRSKVATKYGIVAANQPLAAQAGAQMLGRGGNAVDAAIAANAVMGVVEPQSNGIGGDLFAMVYDTKTRELHGLNSGGWAPSALTPSLLKSKGIVEMPQAGIHSVTVPGAVAGWEALRSKFGTLPMADLLAPAIFYATDGFPVSEQIAAHWRELEPTVAEEPSARSTYLPHGRAPRAGEIFTNANLASALERIARDGAAGFYEGATADAILSISREMGGTMTAADLKEFAPEWVAPIATTYRGWTVHELPPNTQGIAALIMLNLMEQYPLREYGLHSAKALHVMIEAKKLAYADMLRYSCDLRHAGAPVAQMIDKSLAEARARLIDPTRATASVKSSMFDGLSTGASGDTIYLSTIDRHGTIVSLIQSIYSGFGAAIVPPGCGFALQNRAGLFSLDVDHPNVLAPRKRPLHTIIPALMQKDEVRIGFGIMGAWNQAQAHAQFVANIADFDLDIQQALEAGRFTRATFEGCDVSIEELVPAASREGLARLGHALTVVPLRSGSFGRGHAVMNNGAGVHYGASDPRADGAAIPESPQF